MAQPSCSTRPRRSGCAHVVLLSTATAYGAWANNPVPLTEDAPLRPNPGVAMAVREGRGRARVRGVARRPPGRDGRHPASHGHGDRRRQRVAGPGLGSSQLAARHRRRAARPVPRRRRPRRPPSTSPGDSRLDGPRNVAPDGWISGDTVRALAGGAPRVRLPERLALRVAGVRWRWGLAPTPPELLPFTVHPLGGRQRSPASRRVGADLLQRGGLRRSAPGRPVGHAQPASTPGGGARRCRAVPSAAGARGRLATASQATLSGDRSGRPNDERDAASSAARRASSRPRPHRRARASAELARGRDRRIGRVIDLGDHVSGARPPVPAGLPATIGCTTAPPGSAEELASFGVRSAPSTPSQQWRRLRLASSCSATRCARSIGMAKPVAGLMAGAPRS